MKKFCANNHKRRARGALKNIGSKEVIDYKEKPENHRAFWGKMGGGQPSNSTEEEKRQDRAKKQA